MIRQPWMGDGLALGIFFAATFIWTWSFYLPIAMGGHSPYGVPWLALLICGGAGPSLVGVAMVLLTWPRSRWREFLSRCFDPRRIDGAGWVVILALVPGLYGLAAALGVAAGADLPGVERAGALLAEPAHIPLALFISFMSGPWSEEFGWRGFAMDPLVRRFGLTGGSILLGLIWGAWHLPLYWMPGTWHAASGLGPTGFGAFVLGDIGLALIMGWTYLRGRRSVLSAMLLHFSANLVAQMLAPVAAGIEVGVDLGLLASGLALCLIWPPALDEAASRPALSPEGFGPI